MSIKHHVLVAEGLSVGSGAPPKPKAKRKRKPTLTAAIAQARKAGLVPTGATVTAEGVSLEFGNASPTNDLDQWIAKHAN